jgi:hypothetical protein
VKPPFVLDVAAGAAQLITLPACKCGREPWSAELPLVPGCVERGACGPPRGSRRMGCELLMVVGAPFEWPSWKGEAVLSIVPSS